MTAVEKRLRTKSSNGTALPAEAGITISRELVTPERAKAYLDRNNRNRRVRRSHVESLAAAMERGEWRENAETIKIASDGELLDGQHRLTAVILAGLPQWFLVARNVPAEAFATIDIGSKRQTADFLQMEGEANAHHLAAALRQLYGYRRYGNFASNPSPSYEEMRTLLEEEPEIRDAVRMAHAANQRRFRFMSPSLMAVLYHLMAAIDAADAEEFWVRLTDGVRLDSANDPILRLRNQLINGVARVNSARVRNVHAALTIKAWNAYRDGREVQTLAWRAGGASPEPYPEPR